MRKLQSWMQSVMVHPDTTSESLTSSEALAFMDVPVDELESVIDSTDRMSALERLDVYGNAYYARLIECLRACFPVLLHALDEEAFDALAYAYLQDFPSRTYTLGELGAQFADYINANRPDWDDDEDLRDLPDFMVDLARFEWTLGVVFDAEGDEGRDILSSDDLQQLAPDVFAESTLLPATSLRLFRAEFPVNAYLNSVRNDEPVELPKRSPTYIVLNRRNYEVRRHEQSESQFNLLQRIVAGERVGEAIERHAETSNDVEALIRDVRSWFAYWTSAGFFAGISQDSVETS